MVLGQHARFGHELLPLHVAGEVLDRAGHLGALELFFAGIAPVLRRELPGPSLDNAGRGRLSAGSDGRWPAGDKL
ncbi:hypothetical protein ACFU7Y_16525 [Kitasatospora sp. NPDC057542]|uniref:hypothetical protein n=1 Tax=Streptomycetaceae TaxID=2062 RepID=UPI001CCB512C|nr:hypothetical protein [Streptomyces sp. LS1784]